ncbi:hypothetical protein D3C76_830490 [compost metagenome]
MGALRDHQPVFHDPQPRPQPAGVLCVALARAHRPGRARPRVHQGGAAAPGAAGSRGPTAGTRRVLLPDPRPGLARPPGQKRRPAHARAPGGCRQPACRRRCADHSCQRVLGPDPGQRVQPLEAAVRRQLGGNRAPAPAADRTDPGAQDPGTVLRANPPARTGAAQQRPRAHRAHGPAPDARALSQPQDCRHRPGHLAPTHPGQRPGPCPASAPGDCRRSAAREPAAGQSRGPGTALWQRDSLGLHLYRHPLPRSGAQLVLEQDLRRHQGQPHRTGAGHRPWP